MKKQRLSGKDAALKKVLDAAKKGYSNVAKLKLKEGKAVLVNNYSGTQHPFVTGNMEIPISKAQLKIEEIKKLFEE